MADTDKLELDELDGIDEPSTITAPDDQPSRRTASPTPARVRDNTPLRNAAAQQRQKELRTICVSFFVFSGGVTVALLIGIAAGDGQTTQHGAVVSWSSVCSEHGAKQMQTGGSAVDAAIATWLCVTVTHSQSDGLGGGGFLIVYDHRNTSADLYDFRETAPLKAAVPKTPEALITTGAGVGVPGAIRGLFAVHKKYGKKPWSDLFEEAIKLASEGRPVSQDDVTDMARRRQLGHFATMEKSNYAGFTKFSTVFADAIAGKLDGVVKQADLAKTLRQIADNPHALYEGTLAKDIADTVADAGGGMTADDVMQYEVKIRQPINVTINALRVLAFPAPSSGAAVINALRSKEEMLHRLAQLVACRRRIGDPDKHSDMFDVSEDIISGNTTCETDVPSPSTPSAAPIVADHGTSHISVVDNDDVMVSFSGSLNYWFGSMLMTESGILLNNQLADFDNDPNSPSNAYLPGARPRSSMTPMIVYNGKHKCAQRIAIGGINGTYITGALTQVLHNVVNLDMNVTEAMEKRRLCARELGTACANSKDAFGVLSLVGKSGTNLTALSDHGFTANVY